MTRIDSFIRSMQGRSIRTGHAVLHNRNVDIVVCTSLNTLTLYVSYHAGTKNPRYRCVYESPIGWLAPTTSDDDNRLPTVEELAIVDMVIDFVERYGCMPGRGLIKSVEDRIEIKEETHDD